MKFDISFSWRPIRNFLWCYYRWLITSLALEKCKKECSKLFWYKVLVDWNFKFLSFLVDSVLKLFSWCTANIWVRLNKIWPKGKNFSGLIWKKKSGLYSIFQTFSRSGKLLGKFQDFLNRVLPFQPESVSPSIKYNLTFWICFLKQPHKTSWFWHDTSLEQSFG